MLGITRRHRACVQKSSGLLAVLLLSACGLGRAQTPRPDLAGNWYLAYEDVIDVEVQLRGQSRRARVARSGGKVSLHDASGSIELNIDCGRPEVLCPTEMLDTQLTLTNRMGDINDDGDALLLSMHGEGAAPCRLLPGSAATARVEREGQSGDGSSRAIALSAGRVLTRFSIGCVLEGADSKIDVGEASVTLSSGFSAVRR